MRGHQRDDRKGLRQKAEGMKEDGLIFNNVMSCKPFSFLPSLAINNRASEIKWLCMSVCVRVCVLVCF